MEFTNTAYTDDIENISLKINGDEWYPLQARVELSTANTPDYVDMIISPKTVALDGIDGNPTKLKENGGLLGEEFVLSIDTELEAGGRSSEQTKIFTGNLANLSTAAEGAWEAVAWDKSHQSFASGKGSGNSGNFLNNQINIAAASETPTRALSNSPYPLAVDFPSTSFDSPGAAKIQASRLVEEIIDQSPLDSNEVETNFAEHPGVKIGTRPGSDEEVYGGIDREITFSDELVSISQALERIENSTNSTWWFDKEGVFHIGAAEPGNPIDSYNLKFITDTSAGKTTPAWQSVQVIGSGVVSEDGWEKSNMNPEEFAKSRARMKDDGETDTDELAEPVYTYRNLEIQTQAEADAVAKELVNKLRDQKAEGKVTVVGFPEIRPLDAIEMPDTDAQPMGGARYSVIKVVHKINPDDGFITDIHVGGLTRENSTVYNDKISQSYSINSFIASNTTEGLAIGDGI